MDDDLGLLPDEQAAPPPPRRPLGLLIGALVAVAVLVLAGVVWMVASVADRVPNVRAAGSGSPAPATTAAPSTTTLPPTTAAPVRSATTVVVTPPPAPKPTPKPTTAPVPTQRPLPQPTLSIPVGPLVRVPDVVGLRVRQAVAVLRAAGFQVQVIGGVLDQERDDRRIIAQRPTAGAVVRAGSTVILVTNGT